MDHTTQLLNHPSFYYVAVAWLADTLGEFGPRSPTLLRLANAALSAGLLALALWIGMRANWPTWPEWYSGVVLATAPTFLSLGFAGFTGLDAMHAVVTAAAAMRRGDRCPAPPDRAGQPRGGAGLRRRLS